MEDPSDPVSKMLDNDGHTNYWSLGNNYGKKKRTKEGKIKERRREDGRTETTKGTARSPSFKKKKKKKINRGEVSGVGGWGKSSSKLKQYAAAEADGVEVFKSYAHARLTKLLIKNDLQMIQTLSSA